MSLYLGFDKRSDYEISLFNHPTFKTLENAIYNAITKFINQISAFCDLTPIFIDIEVERISIERIPRYK